jgi:predicted ester cyclase
MKRQWILIGTMVAALLLVVGLLAGCSGVNKAQLDAFNAAKTKADANKSLIGRYYEAVNSGVPSALDEFFSPNYKRYLSPIMAPLNATQQKARLAGLRVPFPDVQITVDNIIAEGDFVAISLTVRATHQGPFQLIPPTGNRVTVYAFEVVRIENGKMAEHWGGTDTFNLLEQLGAVILAGN